MPVAGDGSMATTGVADGRLVPVVILDTSQRPDIDDTVRAHAALGPGDVRSYWSRRSRWHTKVIRLILDFQQPAACIVVIEFDVAYKGALLDAIVRAQGLYLQSGRPGDRLRDTFDSPRLLVEVPSGYFRHAWEKIFEEGIIRRFRNEGMSKREAKKCALDAIARWRTITSQRMREDGE